MAANPNPPEVEPPLFTTLGFFIIDENWYPGTSRDPEFNIIGGAASYALVGARIISGAKLGPRIAGIIDKGSDFPPSVELQLRSWGTGAVFRSDPSRLTSKGANIYRNDIRHFEFRSEKKRIGSDDVLENPWLLQSAVFHMCCTVERCEQIIDTINSALPADKRPIYVFEPFPDDCVPEHYDHLAKILKKIDIFTPNLDEACAFLGIPKVSPSEYGSVSHQFQKHLGLANSGTVIRCGADGCHIHTIDGYEVVLPAYHQDQAKVVDVTGGGNSFCGAFATAFTLSHGNWLTAGICGNIASGCVIEELGVPVKHPEREEWNRLDLDVRLQSYLQSSGLQSDFDKGSLNWTDA